ncbi:TPA: FACT complex subunit, variant 2 [Trebouxia sp. C0004]
MAGRSSKGKMRGVLSDKVRVWWPPTQDKKKTDYSGMYWPAKVVKQISQGYEVQYDNGDKDMVLSENVSPFNPPFKFGEEGWSLQVGEFCEVFNGSKSDPAAWVGKIKKVNKKTTTVSYPFHDAPDEQVKPELLRRARVYDAQTRHWSLVTPNQEWKDGEVSSPVELEQCDEETLAAILGTHAKILVNKRAGRGVSSPIGGRVSPMKQQAEAAGSSKKEASASAAPTRRTRKAVSDEHTGDSTRSAKKAKELEAAVPGFVTGLPMGVPASPGGTPITGYITHHVEGLGPVLVPMSSFLAGATSHPPPHILAALQSLAPGGSSPPQYADPPLLPVPHGPTASQLFQHAAVSQLLQQATAAAAAQLQPHQASGSHMLQAATSPWPATAVAGPAGSAAPPGASLAALVPHVPQVVPHVHPAVAAAIAAAAVPKSETAAPSAVAPPPSPRTKAQAAASLVEASTSGGGQEELDPSGDKKRKSRKKKDPAAPKKALTAYLVFINGKRDQVIKEHPEADLKDQVRLLAALWRQISPADKEACVAIASADRDRYAQEKAKYEETLKQEAPTSPPPVTSPQDPTMATTLAEGVISPNGKKRKDHDAPKRPRTAYLLFSMEFRKTLDSNINFNDGTKLAAEAWKKATEEEKAPHVAAAEQEKEVYEMLSAEYSVKKDADAAAAEAEALARQPLTSQAVQSEMAEPRSMAEAPSLPAAPKTVHYTIGPDEGILQELDLTKAKSCLTRVTHHVPLLDFVCLMPLD